MRPIVSQIILPPPKALQSEVAQLREQQIRNAENLHQNVALATENAQPRRLLDLKPKPLRDL